MVCPLCQEIFFVVCKQTVFLQVIVYPINFEQSVNSEKIESSQFGNLYPLKPNTESNFKIFSAKLILTT